MQNLEQIKSIVFIMAIVSSVLVGYVSGLANNKNKNCNQVLAYIPVKGKWLEKNVCLEGEK